jgi:ketosteroid isomerase-like protein
MSVEDEHEVLRINAVFYDAFEHRDLDRMSDVWRHDDSITCVHPGWPALHGWAAVSASWVGLFTGPQRLQFIVTNEQAHVSGDTAWVTCDENLLDSGTTQAVAATNVFVRDAGYWKLIVHHASAVLAPG